MVFNSSNKTIVNIIGASETRITEQIPLLDNLNLNKYYVEFTPTETSAGGTRLYIANYQSHKHQNNLKIIERMNWDLLVLKLSTPKIQIFWESF